MEFSVNTKSSRRTLAGFRLQTNAICHSHEHAPSWRYLVFHLTRVVPGGHPSSQYLLCRAEFIAWCLRRSYADGINHFLRRLRMSFNSCMDPQIKMTLCQILPRERSDEYPNKRSRGTVHQTVRQVEIKLYHRCGFTYTTHNSPSR